MDRGLEEQQWFFCESTVTDSKRICMLSEQVNGEKLKARRLLRHGDEISLGHAGTLENHDVRFIFRSVGGKGTQYGKSDGKIEKVGEVYERYQFLDV